MWPSKYIWQICIMKTMPGFKKNTAKYMHLFIQFFHKFVWYPHLVINRKFSKAEDIWVMELFFPIYSQPRTEKLAISQTSFSSQPDSDYEQTSVFQLDLRGVLCLILSPWAELCDIYTGNKSQEHNNVDMIEA